MTTTLGLDMGTNSIGWALIDTEQQVIIDSGVRVFNEGVNRNTSGSEVSKNKDRRDARGVRRLNFRYKMRRDTLKNALKKLGMFPASNTDLSGFLKLDPYFIRRKGLDDKLSLIEFGRALFHINQRRGFKSNRKAATNEDSQIFKGRDNTIGIDAAKNEMEEHHYRTIGELLCNVDTDNDEEKRKRNRYTLRSWYEQEFDLLWRKQQQFYPEILTEKERSYIYNVIFHQRQLRSQKHLVGFCTFEPKKKCSPKSSPVFQYFRILEQLSRLRITTDERTDTPLNEGERQTLIKNLNVVAKMEFKRLKKLLTLSDDAILNLDTDKLLGNNTYTEIRKIFGKDRFAEMSADDKYSIWHTLHFARDEEWLENYARQKWQLDDTAIKKLLNSKIETGANDGYARLSHKAMKKMIPFMEKGLRYDEAAKEAGYHHSQINKSIELKNYLPDPPDVRNPIVMQAMYQLKKVINTLINEYGMPDRIRVELARDLKLSSDKREQIRIENIFRQREAEIIRSRLTKELGFQNPARDDVIKYLLWEECNETDPYSGDHISMAELYSGKYEIEHIIPYSRSLDDSFKNKTLCRYDYNKTKSNKTPFEAFGQTTEYSKMLSRIKKFKGDAKLSKIRKFSIKEVEQELSDNFFNKQLNDTAYISRQAFSYLKNICKSVQIVKGGATAKLRYLWGLNGILSSNEDIKRRDDHRHHAIDAIVVANTTPFMLHKLSSYHKYNHEIKKSDERFPVPWAEFRQQTENSVNRILVSFHCRNRARGKLHKETNYGRITDPESGEKTFVVRKPLTSLTAKMITNIVNRETRNTILNRLQQCGADINAKKIKIPKDAFVEPLFHPKTGHPIKSVRVKIATKNMIALYGEQRKLYVEPGNNHHIEIFSTEDGSKRIGYVVSLFEAVQRKKQGRPVYDKTPRHSQYPNFEMCLSANEMFLVDVNSDDINWENPNSLLLSPRLYRVQKMDVLARIVFRHHTVSLSGESDPGIARKNPNTLNGTKVRINPIGKIEAADD